MLVLAFHPALESSRMNAAWAQAAREAGHEVRDVWSLYRGGEIDLEAEHAACEAADVIVFQHPLYWYGPPWFMKRWLDEVLKFGWAYGDRMALEGKVWQAAISVGAYENEYGPEGSRRYEVREFLKPFEMTAHFCAMKWAEPFCVYGAGYAGEDEVRVSVERYRSEVLERFG